MAATLLFAATTGCGAPAQPKEVQVLAASTLADLTSGAVAQACSRIYEPSEWAADRAALDRRQLSQGVEAMLKEAGTLSDVRMIHKWSMYELGITGADPQYWQALPNQGIDARVTYAANFSNLGPGILSFTFTHLSGTWALRSISVGVDSSIADAREKVGRVGRVLFTTMLPGTPVEQLDQILAQAIVPGRN
jgi:hypothetical protein